MKLKAVEMQGFKSFPDRTKLTFDDGITVIAVSYTHLTLPTNSLV